MCRLFEQASLDDFLIAKVLFANIVNLLSKDNKVELRRFYWNAKIVNKA